MFDTENFINNMRKDTHLKFFVNYILRTHQRTHSFGTKRNLVELAEDKG